MLDHQPIHRSLILSLHGCMPQGTTALHLAGMCRHLIGSETRRAYRALDQLVRQRLVRRIRHGLSQEQMMERIMQMSARGHLESQKIPSEPYRLTQRGMAFARVLRGRALCPAVTVSRRDYQCFCRDPLPGEWPDTSALRKGFARLAEAERLGLVKTELGLQSV